MAIYGYLRVSTVEQVEGQSLAVQERRVRAVGDFVGSGVERVFCDAGVSGSVGLADRDAGAELVRHMKTGDVIIVSKLDRMFRSASDALAWLETFKQQGVKLILCDIGVEPVTENGISKLFFTILAGMAEFERERIRERCDEGIRAKKASGGHTGGRPPFGYMILGTGKSARCVPDPALADALNALRRCWVAGTSLRGAVAYLHSNHGVRISFSQVGRVYQKFEQDRDDSAEQTQRIEERSARQDVRREESLSE
jgi:putative DNA-invertase from lambdoid prophage Rac